MFLRAKSIVITSKKGESIVVHSTLRQKECFPNKNICCLSLIEYKTQEYFVLGSPDGAVTMKLSGTVLTDSEFVTITTDCREKVTYLGYSLGRLMIGQASGRLTFYDI